MREVKVAAGERGLALSTCLGQVGVIRWGLGGMSAHRTVSKGPSLSQSGLWMTISKSPGIHIKDADFWAHPTPPGAES